MYRSQQRCTIGPSIVALRPRCVACLQGKKASVHQLLRREMKVGSSRCRAVRPALLVYAPCRRALRLIRLRGMSTASTRT